MILTLREIAKRVLEKADLSAADHTTQLNKVNDWINNVYERIVRLYPWPQLIRQYNLTLSTSTTDYSLQRDVEEIIKITDITNGRDIKELSEDEFKEFLAPNQLVTGSISTGDPIGYRRSKILACKELMTAADTV